MGRMITQQLASNHPDRLLTATIMSSTPDPKAIGAAATGGVPHSPRMPPKPFDPERPFAQMAMPAVTNTETSR
jgi:hypothetical protein